MKYFKHGTNNLALYLGKLSCLKDLNQLILVEGCTETLPFFSNNEIVIDMDCVERETAILATRSLKKSMDCAIVCISDEPIIADVVLIEFRFNYTSMRNIDRNSLLDKVNGSIACLGITLHHSDKYYFVFDKNMKQQAIRRFRNMLPSLPTNYIVVDIHDLRNLFF
jgi:hypothetical protein